MAGRCVALFRGVNVGRAKRVAMADLRALFEELGFGEPRTLLNSGNVVFDAGRVAPAAAARRTERAVAERLGVGSRVLVLPAAALATVAAENPLAVAGREPARLLVSFPADPADLAPLRPLADEKWAPEALAIGSLAAYVWSPDGVLASRALDAIGRALGDAVTTRNWATVQKLQALAGA